MTLKFTTICEERGISEKFKFKQDFWVDKKTKPQINTFNHVFCKYTVVGSAGIGTQNINN